MQDELIIISGFPGTSLLAPHVQLREGKPVNPPTVHNLTHTSEHKREQLRA